MNCRDALRLLYDVVDHEANESEMATVLEHIKKCRKCAAQYELEQKFKECIEKKGKFSPECDELRTKISQQLDTLDTTPGESDLFPSPLG